MHHVDLVLDPYADAAVRADWMLLAEAGLPSQAHHRGASNRPHVTLTMTANWPQPAGERALVAAFTSLPLAVRLGGLLVLGQGRYALARVVLSSSALLSLQEAAATACGPQASRHTEPGRWVPHVTLARRMTAADVAAALPLLADGQGEVHVTGTRHWDSQERSDRVLWPPDEPDETDERR